jgi:hypothetical protein
MQTHQTSTFLLWLLGAAAAFALSALCLLTAGNGKMNAFALIPIAWAVALSAGTVHHFPSRWITAVRSLAVVQSVKWVVDGLRAGFAQARPSQPAV